MSTIKVTNLRHESATSNNISLDSSARVGIRVTNPTADLHINTGAAKELRMDGTGSSRIRLISGSTDNGNSVFVSTGDFAVSGGSATDLGLGTQSSNILMTRGGGVVARFTGDGLTFGGDTAAANALDDYEEGTWTPVITSDAGSNLSGTTVGAYVKVGGTVLVYGAFFNATLTGASGALRITGLPFTARNRGSNYYNGPGVGWYVNLSTTSYGLGLDIAPNTSRATILRGTGTGVAGLSASDCNTNFGIEWGFTYEAA